MITRSMLAALLITSAMFAAANPLVPADYTPPLLPAEGKPLQGLVITIDAGHGGHSYAPGYSGSARGTSTGAIEGELNLRVTALLFHHLQGAGAKVHMTRRDDRKVALGRSGRAEELGARTAIAEQTRSHLFLSLHHNSSPRATADGVMILIWPTDKAGAQQPLEKAFGDILREEVEKHVHHNEPFSHYVIDHPLVSGSDIPSAVCEFGFLSNVEFDQWVVQPTSARHEAIGAYNAVVRMWQEHRAELEALNAQLFPTASTRTADNSTTATPAFPLGKPNARFWPFDRPVANATEARHLINGFRGAQMTDRTTFYLETEVDFSPERVVLKGRSNAQRISDALAAELSRACAREVDNQIEQLPSSRLGDSLFAIAQAPMALTWGSPEEGQNVQTQVLLGEPLFLLDVNDDKTFYLAHGIDGYTGWIRADAVAPVTRDTFTAHLREPRARIIRDVVHHDFRMPAGSIVPFQAEGEQFRVGRYFGIADIDKPPTQLLWNLPEKPPFLAPAASIRIDSAEHGMTAARAGLALLHTPYVFGARTSQGLDCSGFVGIAWAAAGLQLPRDANQQVLVGQLVATRWHTDALLPGDILFFLDKSGRIFHTGLSLGGSHFIHSSPPEVQINSLDPADPLYSKGWHEAFAIARRPME